MQFDNPYGTYQDKVIYTVDPEDFQMPYDTPSDIDKETMLWKYHRLHNLPKHLYQIRVGDSLIFGRGF